jgi:predicted acetyltransferase
MDSAPLSIVRYTEIREGQFLDFIREWEDGGEKGVPYVINRNGRSFGELAAQWVFDESEAVRRKGFVPATLYFLVEDGGRILGAIHLRHALNEKLLRHGGHIGYGIRPSERGKGYATKMLRMLLKDKRVRELKRVLLTCDDDNRASSKTIEQCGGVLWDTAVEDGQTVRRYWIDTTDGARPAVTGREDLR